MRDDDAAERALWRRARGPRTTDLAASPRLDAATLAAWLDGRLGDAEADAVEGALARDPAALDAVLDARAALRTPAIAPPAVIARAAALVRPRRVRVALRLACAAALVAALVSGYAVGTSAEAPRQARGPEVEELLQALDVGDDAAPLAAEDDA